MKRILATTAIVALTAFPLAAFAQTAPATTDTTSGNTALTAPMFTTTDGAQISITALMGSTVYIQREGEEQTGMMTDLTDAPDTWENVAEIEDILVSQDGQIASVVIDAGGFLGMDEKRTRVSMDDLQLVPDADDEGEYFVVYTGSRQLIEDSEMYDEAAVRDEGFMSSNEMGYAAVGERPMVDGERPSMMDRTAMTKVLATEVTADQLEGLRVYGINDEWVGDVGELVINGEGQIEQVIVDVGGFLGMGEKEVALAFDEIQFMRTDGMNDLSAYVDMTEEQLESMEEWQGVN